MTPTILRTLSPRTRLGGLSRCLVLGRPLAGVALLVLTLPSGLPAAVVAMKSGMQFEGDIDKIGSINENPLAAARRTGGVAVKPIIIIDDGLRRVFVSNSQVASFSESAAVTREKIKIEQRVANSGQQISSVGPIIRITPFDEYGRRTFSMQGPDRPIDVIQGITEINSIYTKVEGLLVNNEHVNPYVWDMRLATSSIPRSTLSRILMRQIDPESPDDRLRIVRLYIQAERFRDALLELDAILEQFPDLSHLDKQAERLRQLFAQRLLREIQLRRDAGQHQRVNALLSNFPNDGIAGETLLQVRDMLGEYEKRKSQYDQVLNLLAEHSGGVEDPATKAKLMPIEAEIRGELDIHTLNRMADYLRLADDDSLATEQKLALAVSGWLLGSGAGTENLAVSTSLFEVRNAVRAYLQAERPHERQEILDRLRSLEGGTPANVARLLANMTPPRTAQVDEQEIPGLYEIAIKGIEEQPEFKYLIQLPPEYDPHRKYPCVVTLNGSGTTPAQQVDWWAGSHSAAAQIRMGQAARRGFIVIAPQWSKPFQRKYEYSSREHAAVLFTIRDAFHRASIDTDRVFLSGHSMGGTAAWDIGFSHPDVWAGVIPIVARPGRYIQRYWENGRSLPLYFVGGGKDGGWLNESGNEFDRYLKRAGFDCTVVQYQGRGHEHFQDEIHHIFDWMELAAHRRDFYRKEYEVASMRPWDNFFWCVELDGFPGETQVLPAEWPPGRGVRPGQSTVRVLENNRISVRTAAQQATVWLTPGIVDFERQVRVTVNSRDVREEPTPDLEVLLEDVRTRGDRQHPFWAKVEWNRQRR